MAETTEVDKSVTSGTAPLPDIKLKCFMSEDNINRAKAHPSYCLYALPIKEAFWHEHNIRPTKSQVDVQKDGVAWATINGVRYSGLVPNYGLVQQLDAAAESEDLGALNAAKASIKPHAFTMVFKPHHHLHVPISKKPTATAVPKSEQSKPRERAIQAILANPEFSDKEISEQVEVSRQTVKNARQKILTDAQPTQVEKKIRTPAGPRSPEQRTAHRAKPFIPAEV
ncbi:MAG TPA: hypothetical protein VGE97_08880 [Nitrososphaera sp.]